MMTATATATATAVAVTEARRPPPPPGLLLVLQVGGAADRGAESRIFRSGVRHGSGTYYACCPPPPSSLHRVPPRSQGSRVSDLLILTHIHGSHLRPQSAVIKALSRDSFGESDRAARSSNGGDAAAAAGGGTSSQRLRVMTAEEGGAAAGSSSTDAPACKNPLVRSRIDAEYVGSYSCRSPPSSLFRHPSTVAAPAHPVRPKK